MGHTGCEPVKALIAVTILTCVNVLAACDSQAHTPPKVSSEGSCALSDSSALKALPTAITDVYSSNNGRREKARANIHVAADRLDAANWSSDRDATAAKKTAAALNKFADNPSTDPADLRFLTTQVTAIGTRLEKTC